jgi:hypothetical protein
MQPEVVSLFLFYHDMFRPHWAMIRCYLLKLSHCNFYIICSFRCGYLFICLIPRLTLFPFGTSPFLIFTILKILKIMCLLQNVLKTLFLFKIPQLFLLGVLHSSSYVVCLLYHLVLLSCFVVFMMWFSSPYFVPCEWMLG